MSTRRDFLATSAGLLGVAVPLVGRSQALPCPPPQLSSGSSNPVTTPCVPSTMPVYVASMSPFQVRSLSGSYAPSNGTSTLQSVMPSIWAGNDDIMRPWSGGAKSTSGSKMYVHGGGHSDSSNNSLTSFDFAGTSRPTGWAVENAGQTGVSSDISVGSKGAPISVHTYDGMVDMGAALYRFGGSAYPNGFMTSQMVRFDKSNATWTRLPNYPGGGFAGMAIGNSSAGKILAMERWATFFTYAFYRVATNNWGSLKNASNQWPDDGSAAWNPATNTGICLSGSDGFSMSIDWSAETITQTRRSFTNMGTGPALVFDPTRNVYWCWGGQGNNSTLYEIHPTTFAVTSHALTGNAPLTPESGSRGSFGRHVFMDSWRAIGSVASRSSPAYIIRLP